MFYLRDSEPSDNAPCHSLHMTRWLFGAIGDALQHGSELIHSAGSLCDRLLLPMLDKRRVMRTFRDM
jgi:hypothetical protein